MKSFKLIICGILFLMLHGCQQAELVGPENTTDQEAMIDLPMKTISIDANLNSETKASIDSNTGAFSWQDGDIVSVLATDNRFYDFILVDGEGDRTAVFEGKIPESTDITTVAIYPNIAANGTENTILVDNTLNFILPESWTYASNVSNVPMVATFAEGAHHMSFKQVGGVMRFPVNNLPKKAEFIITMHDKSITGSFPVDITNLGESCMTAGTEASTVTIYYSSETEGGSAEFNVPVPTGIYNNFNLTINDSNGNAIFSKDYTLDNKVERSTLLNMKERSINPQFYEFSINGSKADELYAEYIDVRMPYGSDVTKLKPVFDAAGNSVYVNGVLQISGESEINFSSPVAYTIVTESGDEYRHIISISYSDIPVVYINTVNGKNITSKETWLEGTEIYVTNAGKESQLYSNSSIRGRGNTTWSYAKKPYAIKLASKKEVLGMPKHKRWVLLANYLDKTGIRNSIAFEIAKRSPGLEWTPRGQHVDVVLNGKFIGNYYLCEQIKVDKNRVNIAEMESTDITPETISGGYLLEVDKHYDEVNKFYSPVRNMPFMVKEPDEETMVTEQFNWLYNHITEVENALYGGGSTTAGYLEYIDLDSFIDYWLVYELTATGEPTHPKSVYMYKDRGGKIYAGPVWDFDYFTFQPRYETMLINTNAVWNDRIINDPANHPIIKQRWNASREKYRSIAEEIDRQYALIKESVEYNSQIWPLSLDVNKDNSLSIDDAVKRIKDYYVNKFNYMDNYINSYF